MKVIISIYKTNADGSNGLYMVSQYEHGKGGNDPLRSKPHLNHYGWKHELPEISKLEEALGLIFEATKQT